MPELPEVETTRLAISAYLANQTIKYIVVRKSELRLPVPIALETDCPGQKISAVTRRAKYLILELSIGYILIHLGMSGHLRLIAPGQEPKKHDHIDLILNNGTIMRYSDPRRFGLWLYLEDNPIHHKLLSHLGPEPLTDDFNAHYLFQRAQNKKQSIKSFLMNNDIVVGVGNIYAAESLFLAGIHPLQPAGSLSLPQFASLVAYSKEVLTQAIHLGGTTLRDFYSLEGKPGYFINRLQVYGRNDKPCFKCNSSIKTIRIAGRASAFCPICQPLR